MCKLKLLCTFPWAYQLLFPQSEPYGTIVGIPESQELSDEFGEQVKLEKAAPVSLLLTLQTGNLGLPTEPLFIYSGILGERVSTVFWR